MLIDINDLRAFSGVQKAGNFESLRFLLETCLYLPALDSEESRWAIAELSFPMVMYWHVLRSLLKKMGKQTILTAYCYNKSPFRVKDI